MPPRKNARKYVHKPLPVQPAPQNLLETVALIRYIRSLSEQAQLAIRDALIEKFRQDAAQTTFQ